LHVWADNTNASRTFTPEGRCLSLAKTRSPGIRAQQINRIRNQQCERAPSHAASGCAPGWYGRRLRCGMGDWRLSHARRRSQRVRAAM